MKKLKAGTNPAHTGQPGEPKFIVAGGTYGTGGGLSPLGWPSHDGDQDILVEAEADALSVSAPDPAALKLAGIVEAALCQFFSHSERADFLQEIHTRMTRSSKVTRPSRPIQPRPSHTPLPDGSLSLLLVLLLVLPWPWRWLLLPLWMRKGGWIATIMLCHA